MSPCAERSLETMTLVAPSAGMISLISVWRAGNEAPFKPGERAWPGAPIAEVPDAPRCESRRERTKPSADVLRPIKRRPFN